MRSNRVQRVTAEEFVVHPAANGASELVRGEIRQMTPASGAHGAVAGAIFAAVHAFVEARALGMCFPDNTGFQLPGRGETVRSPDMAFVCADRLPPEGIGAGFLALAPDLVVEILSPTETASELEDKLRDYREAGTRLVWVIDPVKRTISVRRTAAPERGLAVGDLLDGGAVLPGFTVPVAHIFARLAPA